MLKDTEIRSEVMPEASLIQLNFEPTPHDQYIDGLVGWMDRVPGVISATVGIGSLALRAAHPPLPLDACRAEAEIVATKYFKDPTEKDKIMGSSFNFIHSPELNNVILKSYSPTVLQAERVAEREYDLADLFIAMNNQLLEEHYLELGTSIMFYKKRINSVTVVDNGYGLQMRIWDLFVGDEPKDQVASKVIDVLIYHEKLFRTLWPNFAEEPDGN